jgi:hypothetical protein
MSKVKSIVRIIIASAVAALFSACASTSSNNSAGLPVDPTSTVKINGSFDIPVEKARVYFQNGAHIDWRDIDRWTTYCSVQMQKVQYSDQPQLTVLPGLFSIVDVRERDDFLNLGFIRGAGYQGIVAPSNVTYKVEMRLQSVEQPDVRSLICEKRVDAYGRFFPTNSEIHTALGDLIEIEPPG